MVLRPFALFCPPFLSLSLFSIFSVLLRFHFPFLFFSVFPRGCLFYAFALFPFSFPHTLDPPLLFLLFFTPFSMLYASVAGGLAKILHIACYFDDNIGKITDSLCKLAGRHQIISPCDIPTYSSFRITSASILFPTSMIEPYPFYLYQYRLLLRWRVILFVCSA